MSTVTPEIKEAFLEMLENLPNYTQVRKVFGISVDAFYRARKADSEWDEALTRARTEGYNLIEAEAHRRAVDGVLEPVFYKGEMVMGDDGQPVGIRRYSDKLLETLLKACKPAKFGNRVDIKGKGDKVSFVFNVGDGDE